MTTPAEITKLTQMASRAKALMSKSSAVGDRATLVMDRYEKTLANFEANINRVSKEDAALAAALSEMGNAGPVLDSAFQDEAPAAPVSAKPSETAHIPTVNGKANAA